jgi:hypothetical protein
MAQHAVQFVIKAKDQTQAAFSKIKGSVGALDKATAGLAGTIAGLVGVGGFGLMVKSSLSAADQIQKLTLRLDASAEALSQYRHVADLSGVSFETFTMGLQRMTRRVAEAANGSGEAKSALAELGVQAEDLAKMRPEQQFEVLADALNGVENQADKVRLAMKLFDSEGVALLQMTTGGAAGLRQMRDEADKLGLTMTDSMVTAAADADDAIAKVKARVTGLVDKLVISLAPAITEIAEGLGAWIDQNRLLIGQDMGGHLSALVETAQSVATVFSTIWSLVESLGKGIGWIAFQISRLGDATSDLAGSLTLSALQTLAPAAGPAEGSAAWVAAHPQEQAPEWSGTGSNGATIVNNFNTQLTRNDATAIASEMGRRNNRQ